MREILTEIGWRHGRQRRGDMNIEAGFELLQRRIGHGAEAQGHSQ